MKVYVSSTFRDLLEYRQKVRDALAELGQSGIAMEAYVAEGKRTVDKCLSDVRECDIYIGLFAWRYGWMPAELNPEQLSITHLEYKQAAESKKQCFVFVLDEQEPWPPGFIDPDRSRITSLRNTASERHGGIPFRNPDDLKARVISALSNWLRSQQSVERPNHTGARIDTKKYFAEMAKRYQRLDLEGLTPPEKEEYLQVTLRSVFVEPDVRADPPPADLPRDVRDRIQQEGEVDPEEFPDELPLEEIRRASDVYYRKSPKHVIDVLTGLQRQPVVILGDPGSGKSTLVKYLTLSMIDPTGDSRLRTTFENFLPILVELRSYVALRAQNTHWKGFLDFIDHLGGTEGFYPDKELLHEYLQEDGKALVVFDGLDEVFNPEERKQVARQIEFFRNVYPRTQIIVTSRIVGYSRKILDDAGFRHFTLQDLGESQVAEFVAKWYQIAFAGKPEEGRKRADRIVEAYRGSPSVRQLAGNPMLLTIMAIIGKHQELPRERWRLYDHAANVLIQHWDVNKYLSEHARSGTAAYISDLRPDAAIDSDDKREMLRRLAFTMQGGKGGLAGNYIHREQLHVEFAQYLKERYDFDAPLAKAIAQLMVLQFRERNFILSLYGANLYGFVHRAFLEFFSATAFLNQFEKTQKLTFEQLTKDVFGAHWQDQSWHEVLRLISGMLDPDFGAKIVHYLAEQQQDPAGQGATPESDKPWNLALSVQCLGELRNLKSAGSAAETVLRQVCAAFDKDMRRRPRLFAFMRDQVVLQAASIRLGWPHNEVLADVLREREAYRFAYIYDHLFGTFIGSVGRGSPFVHHAVLSYAEHERPEQRVLAPFALACGWGEEPGTLPRLRSMADEDQDQTVRYAALYAIYEHYPWHPETLPTLRRHAADGPSSFERVSALTGLAKRFNHDRDVFDLIRGQALRDPDKFPRTAAIKGLGEFFRDRPETLPLLIEIARTDPSPEPRDERYADAYYCREAAMVALAKYWPADPLALESLLDISRTDKVDWMREAATAWLSRITAETTQAAAAF